MLGSEDNSLATQCLVLSQTLAAKGQAFTFSLTLRNSFSFSLDTRKNAPVMEVTKKKKANPSTQKRNARRKTFLESKKKQTESKSAEDSITFISCDLCDFVTQSRKDLNIHMVKQHERLKQLDGNLSLNSTIKEDISAFKTNCSKIPQVLKNLVEYFF